MSSSGPDTLRFHDIASRSWRRRRHQSPDIGRNASPHHQWHTRSDVIQRLEVENNRLVRENDLLKEQARLKEENMRLHGVQIISDVIHLLDEHHIKCDKHRAHDLSPPPLATPPPQRSYDDQGDSRFKNYKPPSPYEQDIENDHRWMAKLSSRRTRSPTPSRGALPSRRDRSARSPTPHLHFSPSVDSIELEEALSKSAAIGKPKYASTPYKCENRKDKKAGTNCNVNGNHNSYDLKSPSPTFTSYFKNTVENLAGHWERCNHKQLHVGPTDPAKEKSKKLQPSAHVRHRPETDLNKTYIISSREKRARSHSPVSRRQSSPTILTAGKNTTLTKKPIIKQPRTNQKRSKLEQTAGDRRNPTETNQQSAEHQTSAAIIKLSLLESNYSRVLGEIAFQLDKRILSFVLNGKFNRNCKYKSFYGYTVLNLQQRVIERERGEMKEVMLDRYNFLMSTLQSIGYVIPEHCNKAVTLVNKYGVMRQTAADVRTVVVGLEDEALLRGIVRRISPPEETDDILLLLQCLAVMAADDGMPMFIW